MNDLATRINNLPITLEGKVHLWLTYKNIKPVSTIQFKYKNKYIKRSLLLSWLKDSGLIYIEDQNEEFLYVSKDRKFAQKVASIMWSQTKKDLKEKAQLFGYPLQTLSAFNSPDKSVVLVPLNFPYYWAAYVRYVVRKGHEMEDSMKAKEWADVIRRDVPLLARKFERLMAKAEIK